MRFKKGDDAAWKAQDLDDSKWQSVTLPDMWERHSDYTNDNVYGWFRRHIEIPAGCKGKDFDLLLGKIDNVDEAFLNGQRIGGTGLFPPDYCTAYDTARRYHVRLHSCAAELLGVNSATLLSRTKKMGLQRPS